MQKDCNINYIVTTVMSLEFFLSAAIKLFLFLFSYYFSLFFFVSLLLFSSANVRQTNYVIELTNESTGNP